MNLLYCIQNSFAGQALIRGGGSVNLLKKSELPSVKEESKESKEVQKKREKGVPIDENPEKNKPLIPERPKDAKTGKEFIKELGNLKGEEREKKILEAISSGNMPDFLREFKPVEYTSTDANGQSHKVKMFVMPDYLAVGSNEDFVRMPMSPQTAQKLAEKFGCILPTKKIVDQITLSGSSTRIPMKIYYDIAAKLQIPTDEAFPLRRDPKTGQMVRTQDGDLMQSSRFYQAHDDLNNEALKRAGHKLGKTVAGIKKELIITERLLDNPGKLAFHGGLKPDMRSYHQQGADLAHEPTYVDYSHGARMISRYVEIDGKRMDMVQVLADPNLCKLVSDERISNALAFYKKAGERPGAAAQMAIAKPPTSAEAPVAEVPPEPSQTPVAETAETTVPAPSDYSVPSAIPSNAPAPAAAPASGIPSAPDREQPPSTEQPSSAGQPSPESSAEQKETAPAGTVYVLGDSLSDGYSGLLKGFNTVHVNPPGKELSKGEFTTSMLKTFKTRLASMDLRGATLVINGGSNDLFNPEILENTKTNLSGIYRLAKEKGMKVVAMTLPPLAHSAYARDGWAAVRKNMPKYKDISFEQYNNDLIERWKNLNAWILSQKGAKEGSEKNTGPDEVVEFHQTLEDPQTPGKLRQDVFGEGGVHLKDYTPMAEKIREGIAKVNPEQEQPAKGQRGEFTEAEWRKGGPDPGYGPTKGELPPGATEYAIRLKAESIARNDPIGTVTYVEFDGRKFMAKFEVHPPTAVNPKYHKGIALYEAKS